MREKYFPPACLVQRAGYAVKRAQNGGKDGKEGDICSAYSQPGKFYLAGQDNVGQPEGNDRFPKLFGDGKADG